LGDGGVVKKYRSPRIFRWKFKGCWPVGMINGRPVLGVKDFEWSMYLLWLEGY
jgi:hypothetical protein